MDKAQFYQKTKGWGIFVVLGICVLAVFGLSGQQKAKAYNPSVRTESIKILPGGMNGDSDGWENGVALFSQDLGATAATGEFDRSNSAFFIDPQAETAATDPEADISDKNIQSDNTPEKRADSKNESEPAASETKTGPTTEENVSEPVPAEDTAPKNESVPGGEPETQVLYTIIGQESPEWIAANDAPGSATDAITDINASTTPAVEQAAGGEVEGIPAVTNAVGGDGASTGTEQAPVDATGDAASKPKKITITKPAFEKSFQLSRFDTDGTMDGTAIKNIQLRFSMAATKPAREADEANLLTVSYSSAGAEWQTLEQIDLNTERSNALNNGYFLAALPNVDTFSDLKDLEVRFTYNASSPGSGQTVYIEAVWLEASYAAPLTSDELADQMRQQVIEKYYRSDQNPTFVFTNLEDKKNFFQKIFAWFSGEKREVSAKITNPRGEESNEGVVIDGENVKIGNIDNWKFRPGRYKVEITVKDGNKENVEIQEFEWGVLTVNSDKSLYKTGDTANINLGVLNEYGHTVCDADVILSVTDPDGDKSYPEVLPSDDCGLDNITETPDYSASYEVAKQGTYKIEVIASTETGTLEITDAFDGMDSVDFGVQRIGPTRINPAAIYTMRFKVTAGKDFSGKMTEFIPADFDIYEVSGSDGATTTAEIADSPVAADTFDGGATTTDEISDSSGAVVQTADNDPATIEVTDAVKMISWNVEMKTGQTYDFSYTFKAPALSPYIFLMGPLQIGDFTESRQWQIASDGTCNSSKTGYWDDTTVWSCGARPGSGDDVTVTAGYTVTIRQTEYASTLSVTESGSGTSILAIGAYSLTVGTTVGITRGSSSGYNAKITIGGGTLTVGTNLTLTSASSGGATLDISGGASTVYVGGNFTVSNTTAGYCTFTPGTSSTVNYNGAGAQGMLGTTYYNLTHSAAGTGTISAATVVNGNFNVSAGTVAFTTRALTLNGNFTNSATVTATSSALTIGGSSSSPSIAGYTTTGGCTFSRTANTATLTGNLTCGSLTMNGTNGTLDLGAGLTHTINGNITLTAGTLLGNSSNLSLIGTWSGAATFTEQNSTVTFASTDSQTVPARSYYSLVSTSTGARTLSNSATTYIAGDFSPGSNTWTTTGTTMTFNGSVSWPYRKQVTITGQSGAGTDYQILLNVGESSGATGEDFDLANHATNFPNDIMFTASDGQTILPYFTESTTGTTPNRLAKIWVKVSANLNTNQNIYVYYGKTGAPSQSSGDKTFRFFDDFNDGTIDANKWTTGNIATYCSNTEASGYLRQSCTTYNAKLYVFAISKSTLTYPMTVEWSGEVGASDIHDSIATGPSGTTCTYDTCSTDTTTSMRSDATFAVATFAQGSTTVNTQRINAGTWVRHVEKLASGAGNINVGGTDYANTGSISQSDDYLILNIRKWDSTRDCISDYDWIFVRKYSATEPAYNTSGSEESVSGLTQLIPAFTYNNLNIYPAVNNATAILGSGTITVNGALNVGNGTNTGVVVTAAATDPNITVVGAFTVNTNTTFTSTDDASKTLNIDGALTITGTFTAPAGTSSTSFTLGGNFVNNGVFNNNSGRITLDGNGTATNQTLSGSTTPTTFYQFYITAGGTRTVYFTDNNHYGIAANGTFSLTGTTSYALTVTRAASTAAWYLDVSSTNTTVSVLYTTAAWSNASGGKEINATGGTNTNGNNNTNWVFVITNYPPTWSTNPHENPTSDNSTPTGVGTNLVINAIAADTESNQYYLAVCKTNAIVANSNSAPTCTGGAWAISAATNAGSEATASYTVLASDTAESYDWYAFACDITVSQYGCTAMSNSGTSGNNGTPFAVDHRPTFTSVANDGAKNPGDTQTITAGSWADSDTAGGQDLGSMYVCKSNDFTGTACGTGGTWCSVTNVAPPANAWLSDYAYRVKIPANATTAGVQTDYTLSLNIVKGTGTNTAGTIYLNSHALNWPYDVRFTAADGSTEISSYRKEYDTTHGTWEIKLNYIGAAGTSDFYIYYGKSAATDSSTIYYANIWGDSFETGDFTAFGTWWPYQAQWSVQNSVVKDGSYAALGTPGASNTLLEKSVTYTSSYAVKMWARMTDTSSNYTYPMEGADATYSFYPVLTYGGHFMYWNGTAAVNLPTDKTYLANTWYQIEYAIDLESSPHKIRWLYVGDGDAGSANLLDYNNATVPSASWLFAGAAATGPSLYIDQVRIRKYVYPEPTWATPEAEVAGSATLSCNFSLPNPQAHGNIGYYAYIIDSHGLAASGGQQGAANTFAVNDIKPTVSGTPTLNDAAAMNLTVEKGTTNIYVKGVITDDNGCADPNASTTVDVWQTTLVGRTGCDTAGEASGNKCYYHMTCAYDATVDSCGSYPDKTAGFKCTVPFQYYANPTDANTPWAADNWTATFIPGDDQGTNTVAETNTAPQEMNSYLALEFATGYNAVSFGSMDPGAHTDPLVESMRLEETGNCAANANLYGTTMTGPGTAIPIGNQRYGLGTTAPAWSAGTALTGSEVLANLGICKSGYTATPEWKRIWWGIDVPAGQTNGDYTGTDYVVAVKKTWASSNDWCEAP